MEQRIALEIDGTRIILDVGSFDLDPQLVEEHLNIVLPLLEQLLSASWAKVSLSDSALAERFLAILAQDLVCQIAVDAAIRQAALLVSIIVGSKNISDHGFPEFGT